jgi:hypothetical protein
MSSIPQEFWSGTGERRWLRLDAPVLGNLSIQQIPQQEQTLETASDSTSSGIANSVRNDD